MKKLKLSKIPSAPLDAEILLSSVLRKKREYLLAHPGDAITLSQSQKYQALISRRVKGEPAAYLTHHKEFYGLDFYVNKNTLIPRPESELIIEEVKKIAASPIIIDVGTGSGCLAITLAYSIPQAAVYATDLSPKALSIARRNARLHKINPVREPRSLTQSRNLFLTGLKSAGFSNGIKIKFLRGNLLSPLPSCVWQLPSKKIIIANLPYLSEKYRKDIRDTSLRYEPREALWGGKDGLKYYRQLFQQISKIIQSRAIDLTILIEINPEQTIRIKKVIKQYLPCAEIKIKKDLAGLNRIAVIQMDRRKPAKMRSCCESATQVSVRLSPLQDLRPDLQNNTLSACVRKRRTAARRGRVLLQKLLPPPLVSPCLSSLQSLNDLN
ncbi:MAG: peptide chain release factor N(5)-glutamine methyltransferase [Candidatus Doudnabacteria bacterium]